MVCALTGDRFFALRDQVIAALADLRARQFFQPMVTPYAHIA